MLGCFLIYPDVGRCLEVVLAAKTLYYIRFYIFIYIEFILFSVVFDPCLPCSWIIPVRCVLCTAVRVLRQCYLKPCVL